MLLQLRTVLTLNIIFENSHFNLLKEKLSVDEAIFHDKITRLCAVMSLNEIAT